VRIGTIVYPGSEIGDGFVTGHYAQIREHCTIGKNVSVGSFSEVGHHCVIGDGVRIHSKCFVPEYTVIKDGAWLGPGVIITNTYHPLCKYAKECLQRTNVVIGHGAIIGAGAVILPGVYIGAGALIGAGSVITESVKDGDVVINNRTVLGARIQLECKLDDCEKQEMGIPDEYKPYFTS